MRSLACRITVVLAILEGLISSLDAAEYFASPIGGGDGSSSDRPFLVCDAWGRLKPGDTLRLLDGIYTGAYSMIAPPSGLKGTKDAPITICAHNDGKVLIDAEHRFGPVKLHDCEYVSLEGIDACHSEGVSSDKLCVYDIRHCKQCAIRRCCGWDAGNRNTKIFGVHDSEHNLLEDCAGWGVCRKTYSCSERGNYTTFRRCWGNWQGSTRTGPKLTMTVSYNSHHTLAENCVLTWDAERMPPEHIAQEGDGTPFTKWSATPGEMKRLQDYAVDQPFGIFGRDRLLGEGVRLFGCVAYQLPSSKFRGYTSPFFISFTKETPVQMRDCIAYVDESLPDVLPMKLEWVRGQNLTAIAARAPEAVHCEIQNLQHLPSAQRLTASGGNILRSPNGAKVWYRYVDGKLTNVPLWPWPMNERIKNRTGVDVTKTVFELGGGSLPSSFK